MKEEFTLEDTPLTVMKRGIVATTPLILSYIPVAITFGVLAQQSGMHLYEILMMSIFVYAGAAQFMAVQMFAVGAHAIEMILAVFVLNFRHFIMSFSFMNFLRHIPLKQKAPLTLGMTDETFALASINKEIAKEKNGMFFYFVMFLSAYSSWVLGTLIGGLLGDVIPEQLSNSMGIALYAMFIGLLVPAIRNQWRLGLIALIAMGINFFASSIMSSGWAIVTGTIFGGLTGVFILKDEES